MIRDPKSGPVFSNISMIKRALHQSPSKSLPLYEIVRYLSLHWNRISFEEADRLVGLALHAKLSQFEEDEATGMWAIQHHEQSDLDDVYHFMRQYYKPYSVTQLSKKVKWKDARELFGKLASDLRFSSVQYNGEDYWILSEWEFANDLIYQYMWKNKITVIRLIDVPELLLSHYDLAYDKAVFAPEIDFRFRLNGQNVAIEISEVAEEDDPLDMEVPDDIKEEVARASMLICKYLNRVTGASAKEIATAILGAQAFDKAFAMYCKAINELLDLVEGYQLEGAGIWRCIKTDTDSLEAVTLEPWKYAVYRSYPAQNIILSADAQSTTMKSVTDSVSKEALTTTFEKGTAKSGTIVHFISYYERIKGYLIIPETWNGLFLEEYGRSPIVCNGYEYWWSWKRENGKNYFFGGGVMDFYFDHELEVGREIRIKWHHERKHYEIDIGDLNHLFASEQARYLDIGRLVEEARTINKSFFVLMYEVLASHPSGMHWVNLSDKVNTLRSVSRNTISQLLSKNDCFVPIENKKGYWRLNSTKLSRYFVNEEGNKKDIELDRQGTSTKNGEKKAVIDRPKIQKQSEEMPALWISFKTWSSKQKGFRYEVAEGMAESEQHKAALLFTAYAKLLCKMAANRDIYSIDHMDLVQEGYLGLKRAMELYSPNEGVPFGHYAKRHILSRMLRLIFDTRTLFHFPGHIWEQIRDFEHRTNKSFQEIRSFDDPGKTEIKNQQLQMFSEWKNVDYISIEQYWSYLSESQGNRSDPEWICRENLDEKSLKVYYDCLTYSDHELRIMLETSCDIVEEDSDIFWDPLNTELCVMSSSLKEDTKKILDTLSAREQYVIVKRFGLNRERELTLEELGKELGCTRERVRQIERRALEKLSVSARKIHLNDYLSLDSN